MIRKKEKRPGVVFILSYSSFLFTVLLRKQGHIFHRKKVRSKTRWRKVELFTFSLSILPYRRASELSLLALYTNIPPEQQKTKVRKIRSGSQAVIDLKERADWIIAKWACNFWPNNDDATLYDHTWNCFYLFFFFLTWPERS